MSAALGDGVRHDPIVYRIGDDRSRDWPLLEIDGDNLVAAGWRACAQVRSAPGAPVLHEWTTENGRAVIEANRHGQWSVRLLTDDSRSWTWTRGVYDLYLIDPRGRAQPIAEGTWINHRAVTDIAAVDSD